MRRISLFVCAATFLCYGALAIADENCGASEPGDTAALARTAFPLPDLPTFEAELADLENAIAAKIEHPVPQSPLRDRVLGYELDQVLELAREWPAQKFREPLIKLLNANADSQIRSGGALLAFRDPELTKLVNSCRGLRNAIEQLEVLRNDEPPLLCIVRTMWLNKKPIDSSAVRFTPVESLLPDWKDECAGKLKWPRGMNVARTASQLQDAEISVRLQAWVWLAEKGIIAPTEAVVESWPMLTNEQKRHITAVRPKFIGRRRLLMLFDQLLFIELSAPPHPTVCGDLRRAQVQCGNILPMAEARRILKLGRQRADFFTSMTTEERDAFCVICDAPERSDVTMLLQFHNEGREWVAFTALEGLCRIDDPDAIHEVGKFLATPEDDYRYSIVLGLIQRQSILELENRALYLAVLAPALRASLKPGFGKEIGERLVRESLTETFECMAGQDFRTAALAEQNKMVRGYRIGIGWSSEKGGSTNFKRIYADLPTATATVCRRWYDVKINAQATP